MPLKYEFYLLCTHTMDNKGVLVNICIHFIAEKPVQLDFPNFHYLFFPDFMFKHLELTCHLTSFHDEFIVAPSGVNLPMPHQFAGKTHKYCKIVRLVPEACKHHAP